MATPVEHRVTNGSQIFAERRRLGEGGAASCRPPLSLTRSALKFADEPSLRDSIKAKGSTVFD